MNLELINLLVEIKKRIKTTRDYLNHEFPEYYSNLKVLESRNWNWLIESYKFIKNERPNIPEKIFDKCESLYCNIFEPEANRFIDLSRQLAETQRNGLPDEEIGQLIWNQYDNWRTKFSHEANKVILLIDEVISSQAPINDNQKKEMDEIDNLKRKIGNGNLSEVVDWLLNNYDLNNQEQNQLINIAFRLNNIKEKVIMGLIEFNTESIETNKIATNLLALIDEIKK